jgi:hypothetical protein
MFGPEVEEARNPALTDDPPKTSRSRGLCLKDTTIRWEDAFNPTTLEMKKEYLDEPERDAYLDTRDWKMKYTWIEDYRIRAESRNVLSIASLASIKKRQARYLSRHKRWLKDKEDNNVEDDPDRAKNLEKLTERKTGKEKKRAHIPLNENDTLKDAQNLQRKADELQRKANKSRAIANEDQEKANTAQLAASEAIKHIKEA